ncbi:MAG TPA: AarF/UbiB family protein [Planctomycetota bacterium]|nr:AarF/UbiB family protein [Planctomycetota bacterium]
MGLSLKPRSIKRYKDIARLFLKYGRSDLLRSTGLDEALEGETAAATPETVAQAHELAADLEAMGATYIKLGQLLSTRGDILPPACADALARLQDKVSPVPFTLVEEIIEAELGVRSSKLFAELDPEPLACASLGQVHRATMRDGRPVVVKVQRPGLRERILEDMEALAGVAELLDAHTEAGRRYQFGRMLEEFKHTLFRELDYRQEARHLTTLADNLKEFDRLLVPRAVDDYTTSRVLTMEYISGVKVTCVSPLVRMEVDGPALVEQLFDAYLKQILVDGLVHADPHPGNVFLTQDRRLALIDAGMVIRLQEPMQRTLLSLLLAVAEGKGDDAASAVLELNRPKEREQEALIRKRVAEIAARTSDATLEQLEIGRALVQIARTVGEHGAPLPSEVGMIGQTLLKLDSVARLLAPEFRPADVIRQRAVRMVRQRMLQDVSLGTLFKGAVEIKEFVAQLPGRVNRLLDAAGRNELGIRVDAIDETRLIDGLQKIANRITVGLVLAALIVGAALLMRVETPYRIWGYPGLAMLLFAGAAIGGIGVVLNILLRDEKPRKRK